MLHKVKPQSAEAEAGRSRKLAEHAALRGLLNCYMREAGIFDPGKQAEFMCNSATAEGQAEDGPEILQQLIRDDNLHMRAFILTLPRTKVRIAGSLVYYSMTGQHQYGEQFYASYGAGTADPFAKADVHLLMDMLLMEVSFGEPEAAGEMRRSDIREQIVNSINRTAQYLAYNGVEGGRQPLTFNYTCSEQSLLYGHPFHPTPKSSEGFTDLELEQYAPEMGASFQLHYMALSNELVCEQWIEKPPEAVQSVLEALRQKLGSQIDHYSLIPLHPWQAVYLSRQNSVRKLIEQGKLVDLGTVGQTVYPTSSVRTVWDPVNRIFYKLPLHVRITNFIRENTTEQVRRTMDAALVLREVVQKQQVGRHLIDTDASIGADASADAGIGASIGAGVSTGTFSGMRILSETGYRSVNIPGIPVLEQERLSAGFAVICRQAEQLTEEEQEGCFVVAALMEQPPWLEEPLLFRAVRQSCPGQPPDWTTWLTEYLKLSMLPLLHLFAEKGISMEAHVQNSLITLERGLPVRYYVRDLEGISIERSAAYRHGWIPGVIPPDSPVLYSEAECWKRLKYYFFVNHLGALMHTIARHTQTDESVYWNTVRSLLHKERSNAEQSRLHVYINDLLTCHGLPAKANFISRFQGRGETPEYVQIPNPIYYCGVSR